MYHFKQAPYIRHTHKCYLLTILFVLQNHLVVLESTTHFTEKKNFREVKVLADSFLLRVVLRVGFKRITA